MIEWSFRVPLPPICTLDKKDPATPMKLSMAIFKAWSLAIAARIPNLDKEVYGEDTAVNLSPSAGVRKATLIKPKSGHHPLSQYRSAKLPRCPWTPYLNNLAPGNLS